MGEEYYVYIVASGRNGTIYVGVTNDLARRVYEHKDGLIGGFTSRYGVNALVHYECYASISDAIQREKNIKKWPRRWKLELIEKENPQWQDLYEMLNQ